MSKVLVFLAVSLPFVFAPSVFGQSVPAQAGTVKAGGQPIPGASVRATQGDRSLVTLTDDNGAFRFDGITPGAWVVEADMFGFDHLRREVQVTVTPSNLDLTLQLSVRAAAPAPVRPAAQNPQASANAPLTPPDAVAEFVPQVSADSSNESFLVNGTVSEALRTNQGDFAGAGPGGFGFPGAGLADQGQFGGPGGPGGDQPGGLAGAGGRGGPDGGGRGGRGGGGPGGGGFAGGRGGGGGFAGGGFGGPGGGGAGGRGGGGGGRGGPNGRGGRGGPQSAAFIGNRARRSANQVRAQVFVTARNSVLDARPFSLNGQEKAKSSYANNRYGVNIGGPVIIPKLFDASKILNFTITYNGTLSRNPYDATATLPGTAERGGDFSGRNPLYDPLSCKDVPAPCQLTQFPGNQIPLARLDKSAVGLLQFIPLPIYGGLIQNYRYTTSIPANSQSINTRVQWTVDRTNRISFSSNVQTRNGQNSTPFAFRDETHGSGSNSNIGWTKNLGTRMFSNFSIGFNRNTNLTVPYFQTLGVDVASKLGIFGASPDPRNYGPPTLSFTNYGGLNDGSPVTSAVNTLNLSESMTYRRGKHNWSWGGQWSKAMTNTITDSNGRGTFTFSGLSTSNFDASGQPIAGTGWDLADFLLGLPQSTSIRYGASSQYFRSNTTSFFGQDDWRIRSNLSLNLGLRYEYFTPIHEKYGHLANLDIAPNFAAVAPVEAGGVGPYSGQFPAALINPDKNNFSPRFGVAWKPSAKSKFTFRAGYGWAYNMGVYNQLGNRLAQQPPFSLTNAANSVNNNLTLETGLKAVPPGQTITNTFAVDRFYLAAYAQSWNAIVQRELPAGLALEVDYNGQKGTRLDVQTIPNSAPPGSPLTAERRRQIGNAQGFIYDSPVGNSIYHGGTLRVTRRFRNSFSWQLNYTFQKLIDNTTSLGAGVAQNAQNLAAERGVDSPTGQTLGLQYTAQSPVGVRNAMFQKQPWLQKSLKDWQLTGTTQVASGRRLTATVLGNSSNVGGAGVAGTVRADATGLPIDAGSGYFNQAAFAVPLAGLYGSAGRGTIPGPGTFAMNLQLARTVQLSERKNLEFSVNATNLLNHVNISGFGTVVNSLNYGLATGAGAMRTVSATIRFRM